MKNNEPDLEDADAVVLFDGNGAIWGVFPDYFEKNRGDRVKLVMAPPRKATVSFDSVASPIDWDPQLGSNSKNEGRVKLRANVDVYKYTVEDEKGNKIDPRMRVK